MGNQIEGTTNIGLRKPSIPDDPNVVNKDLAYTIQTLDNLWDPTVAPSTQAAGDAADNGASTSVAFRLHKHGMPSSFAPSGSAGGDLSGSYPNPTVANLAITDAKVANANKDGAAGTASMRTLGTSATSACAGNDSRLTDSRTPTGSAGGDLTGTYPNPTIASGKVTQTGVSAPGTSSGTTSTSFTDLMSVTITTTGGDVIIWCCGSVNDSSETTATFGCNIDGGSDTTKCQVNSPSGTGAGANPFSFAHLFTGVSAASHTFYARFKSASGASTVTAQSDRYLLVEELKK